MVLVVDDDKDLLEMLGLVFGRADVPHILAASLGAVQAHDPAQLSLVHTAILDVNLGPSQPSGLDVATWLRGQGYAPKIVFITGHAPDHPLVRAIAGEHGEVLEKPVRMRVLLDLVREQ